MTGTLREFATYLARPRLLVPEGLRAPGASARWSVMLALYLGVLLLVIAPLLKLWQGAMGLPAPEAFGKFPPAMLLPLVTIAAPVGEELVFRGWLSGTPRALWLLLCALVAGGLLAMISLQQAETAPSLGFVATLMAAAAGWFVLRRRTRAPAWFARTFPLLFWVMVIVFGLSHLANYPSFSWTLLPMVLPQIWAGSVLGFVRMRIGLPAAMLAHGLANGTALGLAMLLQEFAA